MVDVVLTVGGVVTLVVAGLLRHLQRWSITPPLLGLVAGVVVGPEVLGVLRIPTADQIPLMTEAARLLLAIALMAIALRYPISAVRRRANAVAVLLVVVMPAMAAIVALGAGWLLQLPAAVALVLGAALSPTDPVLASGIVTGEYAERDIPETDRQLLSLESGANDGLALPLVLVAMAWALDRSLVGETGVAVYEVLAAIVIGVVLGLLAGRILSWAKQHREVGPTVRQLYTIVLAMLALGVTSIANADGLLGVFVAGLAHNHVVAGGDREVEVEIDETLNQFLVVPVFVLFGAVLPWAEWGTLGWAGLGLVLVVLVLRRLPVVLALRRPLRATWTLVVWLGWFGPIGVAAIYYLGHAHSQGVTDPTVWSAGTLVVAVSTIVHGLTSGPGRLAYRRHQRRVDATPTGTDRVVTSPDEDRDR